MNSAARRRLAAVAANVYGRGTFIVTGNKTKTEAQSGETNTARTHTGLRAPCIVMTEMAGQDYSERNAISGSTLVARRAGR